MRRGAAQPAAAQHAQLTALLFLQVEAAAGQRLRAAAADGQLVMRRCSQATAEAAARGGHRKRSVALMRSVYYKANSMHILLHINCQFNASFANCPRCANMLI